MREERNEQVYIYNIYWPLFFFFHVKRNRTYISKQDPDHFYKNIYVCCKNIGGDVHTVFDPTRYAVLRNEIECVCFFWGVGKNCIVCNKTPACRSLL